MLESIKILSAETFLSLAALVLLTLDVFVVKRLKSWVVFISILSLLTAIIVTIYSPIGRAFGMIVSDSFASFFKILALVSGILILLISEKDDYLMGQHAGTYAALIILSIVGVMLLTGSEDLLMVFIGLELTTLPLFILAGFNRYDLRSSEGAIKFFLIGAFSTGLTLYGISLLYGVVGSTHFAAMHQWFGSSYYIGNQFIFLLGILFLLVGFGFKLTLVPFHQWAPDAYEGSPAPITAFFSISREAGVIVVALRFFSIFINHEMIGLTNLFMALSILTMTIGNITALRQNNLKRLLAYSSIAHAGTIFIGLVSGNQLGCEGVMLYSVAYSFMSVGAFAVVIAVSRIKGSEELNAVQGLAKENFWLALLMLFFLMSLAGIPPFLGFVGKFYVFASAIQSKMYWLVIIGLINAIVAVYYYFRIVHKMFFQEPVESVQFSKDKSPLIEMRWSSAGLGIQAATLFSAAAILLLGIFPQTILLWIRGSTFFLP